MKKRAALLTLVLSFCLGLCQGPARAETRAALPEGVTEFDLGAVLGDGEYYYSGVWMLNADVCAILLEMAGDGDDELVLLDIRDCTLISRTPVPEALGLSGKGWWGQAGQGWDDGAFRLLFMAEDSDWHGPYVKATVTPGGAVEISASPSDLTIMPGGKTAIRKVFEGSLFAVDLASGKEELLIQGVAGLGGGLSYEAYQNYIPCPDDTGYNNEDPYDAGPLEIPFPLDEDAFQGYDTLFFRDFYVCEALDEHRFVYAVNGWEWGAGYGVYDLRTRTDHRITGRGYFYGMGGNTLYGSALMTDANTYESLPLQKAVQEQFEAVTAHENGYVYHDISPDGRLLALTGMKSRHSDANTVTITDIQTGDIIRTYDIDNPLASERAVAFCDDTHFMLFCEPKELGSSAYIYLFNIAE